VGIDASIDALADAHRAAGVDPPGAPSDLSDLDAVDAAIAPISLPGQVRRFWERVDPGSLRVWAYPHPTTVALCARPWKQHRDEFAGMVPQALFLVGYESWACISVELDSPLGSGGAMFEWRIDGRGFYLRYHDLGGWLDRITELVVAGEFERRDGTTGPVLVLRDPQTSLPMNALPGPSTPSPIHGRVRSYERDPLMWALHWQRLSGIELEDCSNVVPRTPSPSCWPPTGRSSSKPRSRHL
jgi:hypothetical protein